MTGRLRCNTEMWLRIAKGFIDKQEPGAGLHTACNRSDLDR